MRWAYPVAIGLPHLTTALGTDVELDRCSGAELLLRHGLRLGCHCITAPPGHRPWGLAMLLVLAVRVAARKHQALMILALLGESGRKAARRPVAFWLWNRCRHLCRFWERQRWELWRLGLGDGASGGLGQVSRSASASMQMDSIHTRRMGHRRGIRRRSCRCQARL